MRRQVKRIVALGAVALWVSVVIAQSLDLTPFVWLSADLALGVPSEWEAPFVVDDVDRSVLRLAQTQVQNDARPPEIPVMTLTLLVDGSAVEELAPLVTAELEALGINGITPQASTLLGFAGVISSGSSADGLLFGVAQGTFLPDGRVLITSGRAPFVDRDSFRRLYNTVINSLVIGGENLPVQPAYGVLWNTQSAPEDAEAAFLQPVGLALATDNTLYTADLVAGVVQLDATTGAVLRIVPYDLPGLPTDIAVSPAGVVYVSDSACGCVLVLTPDGTWGTPLGSGDFGAGAPRSIAIGADGIVYATDEDPSAALIRVFAADGSERVVEGGEAFFLQPLLTINTAGQLIALSVDNLLFRLEGDQFLQIGELPTASAFATDLAPLRDGFVVTSLDSGVTVFNGAGAEINRAGRVVANFPLPSEVVAPTGVAAAGDGTIYVADGDGSFGSISAFNTRVESGRVGSTALAFDVVARGNLSAGTPQQSWTFAGVQGQEVMITAVDDSGIGELDLAVRLINPAGGEEAYNDDHGGLNLANIYDAQIPNHTLQMSGTYIVIVELVNGEGGYRLGIRQPQTLQLNADGTANASGFVSDVFAVQRWRFEGRAAQVITVTMLVTDAGALDPQLRLLGVDGTLLDENDDAADPALGLNAQIVGAVLPADGVYMIEATRFQGEGTFSLTVVTTSP